MDPVAICVARGNVGGNLLSLVAAREWRWGEVHCGLVPSLWRGGGVHLGRKGSN
jgi:hypothetical protein